MEDEAFDEADDDVAEDIAGFAAVDDYATGNFSQVTAYAQAGFAVGEFAASNLGLDLQAMTAPIGSIGGVAIGIIGELLSGEISLPQLASEAEGTIGALAPVTPLSEGSPVSEELLNSINPGQFDDNCVDCSLALEDSLSGSTRAAADTGPSMGDEITGLYGDFTEASSSDQVVSSLQGYGDGTRAIVVYEGASGQLHAVNAINSGGKVFFIDAQAAGAAVLTGCSNFAYVITH